MMIVCSQPLEIMSHVRDKGLVFDLTDARGHYGYLGLVPGKKVGWAEIHIHIDRWDHTVLRYMKMVLLPELKAICRELGISRLVGKKQGHDPRWSKFIQHFGFSEPVVVQMAYMEV